MAGVVLALLGRLWMFLLSCFSGPEPPPSMLPVSVRPSENSTEGSGRGVGQKNGEGFVNTEQIREHFLRHPSLRSNDREPPSEYEDGLKKKKGKDRDFKLPTVIVQDWSSLPPASNVKPPPRPPRPSSSQIPYVIITPCAPTDSEEITSTVDDFAFNSAISSPLDAIAALTIPVEPSPTTPPVLKESKKKRLITRVGDSKPGSDPPSLEQNVVQADNVPRRDNPFAAPSRLSVYSPPSLVLSESLTKVPYDPKAPSETSHSTVSTTLAYASWNPGPPNDSLNTEAFPYTSTPVKRRRFGKPDSKPALEADSLESDAGTPLGFRLPEDQIDLLPYPDVFDLDMYFAPESSRSSLLPQPSFSSSIIRVPIEDKNPFLVSKTTVLETDDPIRNVTKRFGYVPDVPATPNSSPVSPTKREPRRHRDLYRHHAYSRSPQVAIEDTTLDSVGSITPPRLSSNPPPRKGASRPSRPALWELDQNQSELVEPSPSQGPPRPSRPALRELNQNQSKLERSPSQGPSSTRRVKFSEQEQYPGCSANSDPDSEKVPIVVVSHYRSPSSSTLSDESSRSESVYR